MQLFINVITHPAFAVVTFLGGVWFGNHFALGRDRRKEFNEAAEIMFEDLRKERKFPTLESSIDFDKFRRVLNDREKRLFNKCIKEYEKVKAEQKNNVYSPVDFCIGYEGRFAMADYSYQDSTPIKAAIDNLLKFTERK